MNHFFPIFLILTAWMMQPNLHPADGPRSALLSPAIAKLINKQVDTKIPGGFALAVIDNGQVIYKKALGLANVEHSIPFSEQTVCDYASIAKQFTGFAVAKLILDGAISQDDDIRKYLPEMADFGVAITIRHLLGHTSGLRDFVPLLTLAGHRSGDVIDEATLMKLLAKQKELNFKPGERHAYCNSGYFLLAQIVSRITKMSFAEWTKQNIFIPLGMSATRFRHDSGEIIPGKAASYEMNNTDLYQAISDNLSAVGSSSLFSTLQDMIKWTQNLLSHRVGGEALFALMLTPTVLNNGQTIPYNFGLKKGKFQCDLLGSDYLPTITHGGSWSGFLSQITVLPKEKRAVVFVTNRDPSGVYVEEEILHLLYNLQHEQETDPVSAINQDRTKIILPQEILDAYLGDYVTRIDDDTMLYRFAFIKMKAENIVFHSALAQNNRLFAETERKFFIVGADNRYEFMVDEKGIGTQVKANLDGTEYLFSRIYPKIRDKNQAQELVGEYHSEELDASYTVTLIDDGLVVKSLTNEDVPLLQLDNDLYVSKTYWFKELRFTRGNDRQIDGFLLATDNGNISKNLRFIKRSMQ